MRVRFFGTRGSIATPGPHTLRYGGNTSCIEVQSSAGTLVILDMGTGATVLGRELMARGEPIDDFARYIYLPRLAGPEVLAESMRAGVALLTWRADTFAYAESFDETAGRYRGLQGGHGINIPPDSPGLIVKPDFAS